MGERERREREEEERRERERVERERREREEEERREREREEERRVAAERLKMQQEIAAAARTDNNNNNNNNDNNKDDNNRNMSPQPPTARETSPPPSHQETAPSSLQPQETSQPQEGETPPLGAGGDGVPPDGLNGVPNPEFDQAGEQSAVESLREWAQKRGWYDLQRRLFEGARVDYSGYAALEPLLVPLPEQEGLFSIQGRTVRLLGKLKDPRKVMSSLAPTR